MHITGIQGVRLVLPQRSIQPSIDFYTEQLGFEKLGTNGFIQILGNRSTRIKVSLGAREEGGSIQELTFRVKDLRALLKDIPEITDRNSNLFEQVNPEDYFGSQEQKFQDILYYRINDLQNLIVGFASPFHSSNRSLVGSSNSQELGLEHNAKLGSYSDGETQRIANRALVQRNLQQYPIALDHVALFMLQDQANILHSGLTALGLVQKPSYILEDKGLEVTPLESLAARVNTIVPISEIASQMLNQDPFSHLAFSTPHPASLLKHIGLESVLQMGGPLTQQVSGEPCSNPYYDETFQLYPHMRDLIPSLKTHRLGYDENILNGERVGMGMQAFLDSRVLEIEHLIEIIWRSRGRFDFTPRAGQGATAGIGANLKN
jgi:hypothetical protein